MIVRQGPHQGRPGCAADDLHDRRPGRADGRPGAHGQPRPPLGGDRAGRHGHRQRQPHPGQRGRGLAHDRQPLQERRQRLLPRHQAGPRVGPRQPGRAQADARPDQAAGLHPDARRVPHARAARPPGGRDGRPAGPHLHHRERPADRVPARRHGAPGPAGRGRLCLRRRPVGGGGGRRRPARPARAGQRRHVPGGRDGGQAERHPGGPTGDHHHRLPGHAGRPADRRRRRPRPSKRCSRRATTSARSA